MNKTIDDKMREAAAKLKYIYMLAVNGGYLSRAEKNRLVENFEYIESVLTQQPESEPQKWLGAQDIIDFAEARGMEVESGSGRPMITGSLAQLIDCVRVFAAPQPSAQVPEGWKEKLISDYRAEYCGQGIESWLNGLPDSLLTAGPTIPRASSKWSADSVPEGWSLRNDFGTYEMRSPDGQVFRVPAEVEITNDASPMQKFWSELFGAMLSPSIADKRECEWRQNEDDGRWYSSCGVDFEFYDGGPEDNNFNHCHGCGFLISVLRPEPLEVQ